MCSIHDPAKHPPPSHVIRHASDANAGSIDESAYKSCGNHNDDTCNETIDTETSKESPVASSLGTDNLEDGFDIISLNPSVDPRCMDPSNDSVVKVETVEIDHDLKLDPYLNSAGKLENTMSDIDNESVSSFTTGLNMEEKEAFDNLSRYEDGNNGNSFHIMLASNGTVDRYEKKECNLDASTYVCTCESYQYHTQVSLH